MSLPKVLKNMNLFGDGQSYLGQIEEVTVPKLAIKAEAWRGGGMLGEVDLDMGLEKLECEWKPGGLLKVAFNQFGRSTIDGVQLRWLGAYQDDSTGQVMAAEVAMRGRHMEIDNGTAKPGDKGGQTIKTSLAYYRLKLDGSVRIEIDMMNCVFIVDGIDRYAEIRAAIGM